MKYSIDHIKTELAELNLGVCKGTAIVQMFTDLIKRTDDLERQLVEVRDDIHFATVRPRNPFVGEAFDPEDDEDFHHTRRTHGGEVYGPLRAEDEDAPTKPSPEGEPGDFGSDS